MERLLIKELIAWKNKPNHKPLILKGVRQCGKTYLLKEFGKNCFDDFVYCNFEENDALKAVFERNYDTKRILFELSLHSGKTITAGKTLLILDEIQECGRALTSLKYFCENAPEYHIACAGSLLGIALQEQISFPVGKVDFLSIYPMNFTEFLMASGEERLADYLVAFPKGECVPKLIADKLETLLKQYFITGGMPEVVSTWITTHNLEQTESIQQSIINSYELDFAKHAPIREFPKLQAIWRSIPQQLAKENAKFIFSQVKKGWRSKDLEDALEWLIGAGLVYKVRRIEKPSIPLSSYADDTAFKLYLADIGLLRKLSGLPGEVILGIAPTYREFKGAMSENYALGELISSMETSAYYWTSGNTAEVDFVIQNKEEIIPIEVKSEKNTRARSLAEYRKKYNPNYPVETSMKPEVSEKGFFMIPLYMISQLGRLCQ